MQLSDGAGEGDSNLRTAIQLEARTGPSRRPGHEGEIIEAFQLGEPQWESLVRQLAQRGAGGGRVDRFYSDDGYFCYNFQGPTSGQAAGRLIKYRIKDDAGRDLDESKVGEPGGWIAEAELVESAIGV